MAREAARILNQVCDLSLTVYTPINNSFKQFRKLALLTSYRKDLKYLHFNIGYIFTVIIIIIVVLNSSSLLFSTEFIQGELGERKSHWLPLTS